MKTVHTYTYTRSFCVNLGYANFVLPTTFQQWPPHCTQIKTCRSVTGWAGLGSSLSHRWNCVSLGWWRKGRRAVWGFEARLFRRRLFKGRCWTPRCRYGPGHSPRGSGGGRGRHLRWCWSPGFGVLDWQLLVCLVRSFGWRMRYRRHISWNFNLKKHGKHLLWNIYLLGERYYGWLYRTEPCKWLDELKLPS